MQRKRGSLPELIRACKGVLKEPDLQRVHRIVISQTGTGTARWGRRRPLSHDGIIGIRRIELFIEVSLHSDAAHMLQVAVSRSPRNLLEKPHSIRTGSQCRITELVAVLIDSH